MTEYFFERYVVNKGGPFSSEPVMTTSKTGAKQDRNLGFDLSPEAEGFGVFPHRDDKSLLENRDFARECGLIID